MITRSPRMSSSNWTSWRLTFASLGALLVGAVAVGAVALSSRPAVSPLTTHVPPTIMALAADATATPTPRVIAIPGTVTPPAPTQMPATNPTPTVSVIPTAAINQEPPPLATATPTPWLIVADESTATPRPRATVVPSATALPSPTPTATAPPPTVAPTTPASPNVRIAFAAENWDGGFYRGDGQAYGRPWVAVYGSSSAYPRASLPFALEAAPDGPAIVTIVGLDDEWAERNEIALEVNGQVVFTGPSPFANWDGVGDGANAAWTSVPFSIPAGSLRAGPNEIALANLNPAGNFNAPPYVLVSDVTLDLPAATDLAAQPATERVEPSKARDRDPQVSDDRKKPKNDKDPKKPKKPKKAKKQR
jgi:hypothetical protein